MRPIVVADASVVIKWFHAAGEEGLEAAHAVLDAAIAHRLELVLLDLLSYEVGNVLSRVPGVTPDSVGTVLEAIREIQEPVSPTVAELTAAAGLAIDHGLTFYDAAYAAVALGRGGRLATYDRQLLAAGLGEHPGAILD